VGPRAQRRLHVSDTDRMRGELLTLAGSWRRVFADDPTHARPIISSLLKGRVTIAPTATKGRRTLSGEGMLFSNPYSWGRLYCAQISCQRPVAEVRHA